MAATVIHGFCDDIMDFFREIRKIVSGGSRVRGTILPASSEGLLLADANDSLGRETAFLLFRLLVAASATYFVTKWLLKEIDPARKQGEKSRKLAKELMKKLEINDKDLNLNEHELEIASSLVLKTAGSNWNDIGGCDALIASVQQEVILPLSLCSDSQLLAPPKGVLLYGPPGCGKTLLAKGIARAAGARFLNLQISTLTNMWYGESQKMAAAVFSLAKKIQPVIIFVDEIDSFLRSRDRNDHEATAMMKAQFMSQWDGFSSDPKCSVIIMGATNRPTDVDPAILRRMPARFHVGMPDVNQRESILRVILRDEPLSRDVNLDAVAAAAQGFTGSDLKEACRLAAITRATDIIGSGGHFSDAENASSRPISQSDLIAAVKRYAADRQLDRFRGFESTLD